jgi:hypothetical protein
MEAAMRRMKEILLLEGDIFYGDLLADNMPSLISYSAGPAIIRGTHAPCFA